MVPKDYRLDYVVARLIERLEGQRKTFAGKPAEAHDAFERSAVAQIDAAIGEMRGTGWADGEDKHEAFLKREVLETFLPRYHAAATSMSAVETSGYGLGPLADPLGRLGLIAGALLFGWLVLLKMIALPIVWPLILLTLAVPFAPDIASMLYRRRYRQQLDAIVDDMTRIQDQENAYLPEDALKAAEEPPKPRPRQKLSE